MNEEYIFKTEEIIPPQKNSPRLNIFKYFLLTVILIFALIGFASTFFYLGKRSAGLNENPSPTYTPESQQPQESNPSPTPTEENFLTPTPQNKVQNTATPTPIPKSKILKSTALLDGFRTSTSLGNNTTDIRAGRNDNLITRGFVSFDIDEIPQGTRILEAKLRLYQVRTVGKPYQELGKLLIDHLTFGDSLDANDYSSPALISSFDSLSEKETLGWKEADVTTLVKDDIANARSKSQYRLHFEKEVKGGGVAGDFVFFESADNSEGTGNLPQLVIKYY